MANNSYVTKIRDLEYFQGDKISIPFAFKDENNNMIDLRRVRVELRICPYGQPDYPVLVKAAQINQSEPHRCLVNLYLEDTINLDYGKYTYQPVIINGTDEYIRAQGYIIFSRRIRGSSQ